MSNTLYPRILNATMLANNTVDVNMSVFHADGTVTALYAVVFEKGMLNNSLNSAQLATLKTTVINNGGTSIVATSIVAHKHEPFTKTGISNAITLTNTFTFASTATISSSKAYDVCVLAIGTQAIGGASVYAFDFALVSSAPNVVESTSSTRPPFIEHSSVTATVSAEVSVDADVEVDPTIATTAYAYVFAETGDRTLSLLDRLEYIKDPTNANAIVKKTLQTSTQNINGTALPNVINGITGAIVPASAVNAGHVYVVGSNQINSADVANQGALFDSQTYEILAANDNPHVYRLGLTGPTSSDLTVNSGTVFSSKANISGYFVFAFVTNAPIGSNFVDYEYLDQGNVTTFVTTHLNSLSTGYTTNMFGASASQNVVYYDTTNVPRRYNVGYITPDRIIHRAFNSLSTTTTVNITNTTGWIFTPFIVAVDTTLPPNYGFYGGLEFNQLISDNRSTNTGTARPFVMPSGDTIGSNTYLSEQSVRPSKVVQSGKDRFDNFHSDAYAATMDLTYTFGNSRNILAGKMIVLNSVNIGFLFSRVEIYSISPAGVATPVSNQSIYDYTYDASTIEDPLVITFKPVVSNKFMLKLFVTPAAGRTFIGIHEWEIYGFE